MLSKTTEYAIRALVSVELNSRKGQRPGFKTIARDIDAPEQYVAKIMQTLTRFKLLKSVRGRGGGFFFTEDNQQDIFLYDVVWIMEGKTFFTRCGFGFKHCDANNPCPLHNEYEPIREAFTQLLKKETIRSLATKIEKGEAVLSRLSV
ncbi:MAG: Rrf2 family transcriptional regulator [Bacteroidales bacterium]|nr:Rrf2 family transcriptional regulator [Bacteroidales bacterium]